MGKAQGGRADGDQARASGLAIPTVRPARRTLWQAGRARLGTRVLPEEVPVGLSYNGVCHFLLWAAPGHFDELAIGHSLMEGIVHSAAEIRSLEVLAPIAGVEVRMAIPEARMHQLIERACRGAEAGENLADLLPAPPPVSAGGRNLAASQILAAADALASAAGREEAGFAAGLWTEQDGLALMRADAAQAGALAKLAGGMSRQGWRASEGIIAITGAVSAHLACQAARLDIPLLAFAGLPSALAVTCADISGMTLARVADQGVEVFSHGWRIDGGF